ncbi:MAG: TlpA family protein disulfide reductase [Flavobacteriales bacterium]
MVLLSGCNAFIPEPAEETREGYYEVVFDLGEIQCPTRWEISKDDITIINADEHIVVSDYKISGDSASFNLPVFGTRVEYVFTADDSLKGVFKNQYRKGDYQIPFNGHKTKKILAHQKEPNLQSTYDVTMDSGEDAYKAIGVFNSRYGRVTGTFLTETGDYRFLEGEMTSETDFYLSCFDGSHLFYFSAEMKGDSITGKFYSGNHWNTTWDGVIDKNVALTDPNTLTYLNDNQTAVDFIGIDTNRDTLEFNSMDFNKVTMVQILGTWCPNCMDESRYYRELSEKYRGDLDIIALAFERPSDLATQLSKIETYKKELGLNYPVYLSGNASKAEASEMFSELNGISSFPTAIFIDKKGMVRKIHTGFYGPGTGKYFSDYVKETEAFLEGLIGE